MSFEVLIENVKLILFNKVQPMIEEMLNKYQNQNINNIEPFDKINPPLDNITDYFMNEFREKLKKIGMILTWIEVSENATISYFINVLDEADIKEESVQTHDNDMDMAIDDIIMKSMGR